MGGCCSCCLSSKENGGLSETEMTQKKNGGDHSSSSSSEPQLVIARHMTAPTVEIEKNGRTLKGSGLALVGVTVEQDAAYWEWQIERLNDGHDDDDDDATLMFGVATKKNSQFYRAMEINEESGTFSFFLKQFHQEILLLIEIVPLFKTKNQSHLSLCVCLSACFVSYMYQTNCIINNVWILFCCCFVEDSSSIDKGTALMRSITELQDGDTIGVAIQQSDLPMIQFLLNGEPLHELAINRFRGSVYPSIYIQEGFQVQFVTDENQFKEMSPHARFGPLIVARGII